MEQNKLHKQKLETLNEEIEQIQQQKESLQEEFEKQTVEHANKDQLQQKKEA